ncbi:hypothetical protein ACLB2K_002937 [Fragaria x ananassa]
MADNNTLRAQISSLRQSFFDEGMLDDHYVQLEELEAEDNPHFCEEVMTMFLRDCTKLIATLERSVHEPEFDPQQIDQYLHQLKGSSSSVGAAKVWSEVNILREILKADGDYARFRDHLAQLKVEHQKLEANLEPYFQVLRQLDP